MQQQESVILLPGMNEQSNAFMRHHKVKEKNILVMGSAAPHLLKKFLASLAGSIDVIIDNEDALLSERLQAPKDKRVRVRYMDFSNTDFQDASIDIVYTQGAASVPNRARILTEVKRILKPGGIYALGELVYLKPEIPVSISKVWEDAGISPIEEALAEAFYQAQGFSVLDKTDLSKTLYKMYEFYRDIMQTGRQKLTEEEQQLLKHDLVRLKHEAEMFTRMGGDKFTGYFMYELQKAL